MKIRKLRMALGKAQSLERAAKEALDKVSVRASSVVETLSHAKAVYKTARKHLKQVRKEAVVIRSAQKLAKSSHRKCRVLLEKLARKLKKMERKAAKASRASGSSGSGRKAARPAGKKKIRAGARPRNRQPGGDEGARGMAGSAPPASQS